MNEDASPVHHPSLLCVESVVAAHTVSPRRLHRIFGRTGVAFTTRPRGERYEWEPNAPRGGGRPAQ